MEIRETNNKEEWESFFEGLEDKTFLQSWNWGEFHTKNGAKVWRLGVYDEALLAVALVVKIKARRGIFLLIQHAPVITSHASHIPNQKTQILQTFLQELKHIGKEEGAMFVRMAPLFEESEENIQMLKKLGFRRAPMHANAYDATWKLDITPAEDDLLKNMRKTTRYLIKQTSKNPDIEIVKSNRVEDLEAYATLNEAVAERQQFVPFSKEFIKNEFEAFVNDGEALLFFGKYKGKVVAGALVIFWSGVGFYHQAASIGEYSKLSIPYRIQWEAIREAKARGCGMYDFWGYVNPDEHPSHPWAGPTRFKMGFGGKAVEYIKTQDYPLSLRYWPIVVFEQVRKMKRHL